MSTRGGFDKVIFLVDRRELDSNTSESFKAYAAYEAVSVDDTAHTSQLKQQLFSSRRGIVVTTTFKLNILVKELMETEDYGLADKNIVFIIDEAHRTTMGSRMVNIKTYFKKNGLFYSYTGTPLFDENPARGMVNQKSELIDTTEKLFGPELHKYTIDQAIADGNVLGFNVDYLNTGEFVSYDELRGEIYRQIELEKPDMAKQELERLVYGWSELDVEKEAVKRGLLIYQDKTHIPRVVERILENWEVQSKGRVFNGILTVALKKRAIAYYKEFKKQLKGVEDQINIALTFCFGLDGEKEMVPLEIIEMMFKDYAEFTGVEFAWDDENFHIDEHTWKRYVGAYKNLTYAEGERIEIPAIPLRGQTKLAATQYIDDKHILSLIGSKIKTVKGIKTVDAETLRLIYEEIQELRDMGQAEQAKLVKEFVDTELLTGRISDELDFDQDFENWKQAKIDEELNEFAQNYGLDVRVLAKALERYDPNRRNVIPYVDEIQESIDFSKAENQEAGNQLAHTMCLLNVKIPQYLLEKKQKYE